MAAIDDGGAAFPAAKQTPHYGPGAAIQNSGMSLRDWFAGQALAGILAQWPEGAEYDPEQTAKAAYEYADAMIAARKGGV